MWILQPLATVTSIVSITFTLDAIAWTQVSCFHILPVITAFQMFRIVALEITVILKTPFSPFSLFFELPYLNEVLDRHLVQIMWKGVL